MGYALYAPFYSSYIKIGFGHAWNKLLAIANLLRKKLFSSLKVVNICLFDRSGYGIA